MVRLALFLGAFFVFVLLLQEVRSPRDDTGFTYRREDSISNQASDASETTFTSVSQDEQSGPNLQSSTTIETNRLAEEYEFEDVPVSETRVSKSSTTTLPVIEDVRMSSLQPEVLNETVRSALVNILCEASSPLRSISGSGVLIDSRGIILTNAHIAQYLLLENSSFPVSCTIRTGSPAVSRWHAKLIFIPEKWIRNHAKDILSSRATGTGEHDYAFLAITESIDGTPLPASFSSLAMNFKEAAAVTGDSVLIAGYPAEFIGGSAARSSLHVSSVFSTVKQLLTFTADIIDVVSVEGTALAQSGSSGGGFIDLYGSLVGLIVTTSVGETTGVRALHAITPSHINRSVHEHTESSVEDLVKKEVQSSLSDFVETSDVLSNLLQETIRKHLSN